MKKLIATFVLLSLVLIGCEVQQANQTLDPNNTNEHILVGTDLYSIYQNNWKQSSVEEVFAVQEDFLSRPNDYFDEGDELLYYLTYQNKNVMIQYKINGQKNRDIYCIVFNNSYSNNVTKDITMSSKIKDVINSYGKPTFEDEKNEFIGYKYPQENPEFYMFFSGTDDIDQIAIYPVSTMSEDALITSIANYEANQDHLQAFDDFDLYFDYSKGIHPTYKYHLDSVGIKLELTVGRYLNEPNKEPYSVTIYQNYKGKVTNTLTMPEDKTKILAQKEELLTKGIKLALDIDLVYASEVQRHNELIQYKNKIAEKAGYSPNKNIILYEKFDLETGSRVRLIKKEADGKINNLLGIKELWGAIEFEWINERYIAYSQMVDYDLNNSRFGIFIYDTVAEKELVVEQNEDNKFQYFTDLVIEDGKIKYERRLTKVEVAYSINKEGTIEFDQVKTE